jgi:hypothetical protein
MVKKLGGEWELVRWAQDVSASSVGGAKAIPAMTAIRKRGEDREVLHGHAAVRARKRNPGDWEISETGLHGRRNHSRRPANVRS